MIPYFYNSKVFVSFKNVFCMTGLIWKICLQALKFLLLLDLVYCQSFLLYFNSPLVKFSIPKVLIFFLDIAIFSVISWISLLVSVKFQLSFRTDWVSSDPYFELFICCFRLFSLVRIHFQGVSVILWWYQDTLAFCSVSDFMFISSHFKKLLLLIFEFAIIWMGYF